MSHTRTVTVDAIISLQGSDGEATQLIFEPFFLILLQGNVIKSELHSSLFLTPLSALFLVVRCDLWLDQLESVTGSAVPFSWLITVCGHCASCQGQY